MVAAIIAVVIAVLVIIINYVTLMGMASWAFSVILEPAAVIYHAMRASKLQPIDAMHHT